MPCSSSLNPLCSPHLNRYPLPLYIATVSPSGHSTGQSPSRRIFSNVSCCGTALVFHAYLNRSDVTQGAPEALSFFTFFNATSTSLTEILLMGLNTLAFLLLLLRLLHSAAFKNNFSHFLNIFFTHFNATAFIINEV